MEASQSGARPLKFIRDVASDKDFFGTHDKVASAIAEVVQTNTEIKVIGLLGTWGSGKSTVVHLLDKHLSASKSTTSLVFTYDAWLHQSDPPRRSFLETLLHFLIDKGMTKEEDWSEKLDVLNRRVEDNVTTTTPRLKWPGTLMISSLLLVPLGARFTGPEWYKAAFSATTNPNTPHAGLVVALSLICLIAPFIVASTFYLWWRSTKRFWTPAFWTRSNLLKHRKPYQDESILAFFMNKETKTNYNRLIKEPEPSAIEFQDAFREVMEQVIPQDQRLIIVIDNLDRLPESEAIALWATIRSFFLGPNSGLRARKPLQHPIVLLPIAEDAIEKLYDKDNSDGPSRAKSFMDKTFDLTFYVNRPVLTKWNNYLERQMKDVFGETMKPSWPLITARLYERQSRQKDAPAITPRGINTLINAIATRWMQWQGAIEFASIAYYCIFRDEIEKNIINAVANPNILMREYDENWQKAIAAIYYGTDPDQVEEVLLEQPLRKAIFARDAATFTVMTKISGFAITLHRMIEDLATSDTLDFETSLNAAWLLGQVDTDVEPEIFRQTWAILRANPPRDRAMESFGKFEAEALKRLYSSAPENKRREFAKLCADRIASLTLQGARNPEFLSSFITFWGNLLAESFDAVPEQIVVPGDAKIFVDAATSCLGQPDLLSRLTTAMDDPAVAQQLAEDIREGSGAERRVNALFATKRVVGWNELTNGLTSIVRAPANNPESMAAALLALGHIWSLPVAAPDDLRKLASDGSLTNRLNEAYPLGQDAIIGRSLALLVLLQKPFSLPDQGEWESALDQRPMLREEIDQALRSFAGERSVFTRIVKSVKGTSMFSSLASDIISRWVRLDDIGSLDVGYTIDNLPSYVELLQSDELKNQFIVALSYYESFWEEMANRSLEKEPGRIMKVLLEDLTTKDKASDELRARLIKESRDDWKAGVLKGGRMFELATSIGRGTEIGDPTAMYGTLDDTLGDLLGSTDSAMIGRWFIASSFVTEGVRSTLFKNVRDRINAGTVIGALAPLIETGGQALLENAGFELEPDESVRHVVRPLLDSGELSVLLKFKEVFSTWITTCPTLTQSFIRERLDALQSNDEERSSSYEALRIAWGLPEFDRREVGQLEQDLDRSS